MFDVSSVLRLFAATMRDPVSVAEKIKGMRAPHEAGWMVLAIGTIGVVVLLQLERLMPGSSAEVAGLGGAPVLDVIILGALSVMMVFVFYLIGRSMGGDGTFGATLALMAWFQMIVLVLVGLQVIVAVFLPPLAGLVAVASFVTQIYCLVHFVNVLHGFESLAKAAGLLVVSIIGLGFGLALLVVLIGGVSAVGGV